MTKKFLAVILVFMIVLSMGTVSANVHNNEKQEPNDVQVNKLTESSNELITNDDIKTDVEENIKHETVNSGNKQYTVTEAPEPIIPVEEKSDKRVIYPDKPMIAITYDDGPSVYTPEVLDILKENNENEKIITLCEEAILIEPYEENIHINLIDAMLALGQQKSALKHYENSLNLMEKEFDAKPSTHFIGALAKIQSYSVRDANANIASLETDLEEKSLLGAMQCNAESFKFLFNLQKRKSLRNDEKDYICIISVNWNRDKNPKGMSELLRNNLRKGDVFTFWNQNQILLMLHNMKESGVNVIENRIYDNLKNYTKLNSSDINMDFQAIMQNKNLS